MTGSFHPPSQVAWTRGQGCGEVADALSPDGASRIEGDLTQGCIESRIDTLVSKKLTSFDLVPVVVPTDVELAAIESITVAVGQGPHSPFAVSVAARIGESAGVPVVAVSVRPPDLDAHGVQEHIESLTTDLANVESRIIEGTSALALIQQLDDASLLVVGAPGGSWLQRQIYGPGRRLRVAAPAGVLTVRTAPARCFHVLERAVGSAVGADLAVADALALDVPNVVAVADHGELVGVVRKDTLAQSEGHLRLRDVMDLPVAVHVTDSVEAVDELADFYSGSPVPVIDTDHRLLGVIASPK